tara:strand:+ start:205 stop:408 length:204 start_codon:yes stop_codon:yes gene_type:complete
VLPVPDADGVCGFSETVGNGRARRVGGGRGGVRRRRDARSGRVFIEKFIEDFEFFEEFDSEEAALRG